MAKLANHNTLPTFENPIGVAVFLSLFGRLVLVAVPAGVAKRANRCAQLSAIQY